jgi:mono/diheme cytochrome c family protein
MSKFLRILAAAVGLLLALIVILAFVVYTVSNRHLHRVYSIQPEAVQVPATRELLARGEHLAATRGCTTCHGSDLGGAKVIDDPAMGKLFGPNITRGQGSVVADYKNIDWVRSIQHGITPSGRPLMLMPSEDFTLFTTEDLGALIAYAQSVPPVDRPTVPIVVGPVARALMTVGKLRLAAEKIDHQGVHASAIEPAVSVAYGRYVAVSCIGCHNPSFSGGKIAAGPPNWPPAANLTPDYSSRLKRWSEAEFLRAIRTGLRPDDSTINPIMPRGFGQMNDTELKAVYLFLQSLPPKPTGQS